MKFRLFVAFLSLVAAQNALSRIEAPNTDSAAPDWRTSASRKSSDRNRSIGEAGYVVAIDIGHTLRAGGAISASGVAEYKFNKRMVELIIADLRKQAGLSAFIVDQNGGSISLSHRSGIANEHHADLFLSIHHDSVNDRYLIPVQSGGETHYYAKQFHGYSVFFSQKNPEAGLSFRFARALGAAMKKEGLTPTHHHAEKIAGESRDLVVPELGVYRFDDLVVLKASQMPAALLECGVIVNPDEERELNGEERQAKTVRAVREAVLAMANEHASSLQDSPSAGR